MNISPISSINFKGTLNKHVYSEVEQFNLEIDDSLARKEIDSFKAKRMRKEVKTALEDLETFAKALHPQSEIIVGEYPEGSEKDLCIGVRNSKLNVYCTLFTQPFENYDTSIDKRDAFVYSVYEVTQESPENIDKKLFSKKAFDLLHQIKNKVPNPIKNYFLQRKASKLDELAPEFSSEAIVAEVLKETIQLKKQKDV